MRKQLDARNESNAEKYRNMIINYPRKHIGKNTGEINICDNNIAFNYASRYVGGSCALLTIQLCLHNDSHN